jgi:tRNA-splicing ligase RtcB
MAAAANYGRANRQLLTEATREAFRRATGAGDLQLVYDVSHNLAKLEPHLVAGKRRLLCVHRKGATRALPPGHPDLPDRGLVEEAPFSYKDVDEVVAICEPAGLARRVARLRPIGVIKG